MTETTNEVKLHKVYFDLKTDGAADSDVKRLTFVHEFLTVLRGICSNNNFFKFYENTLKKISKKNFWTQKLVAFLSLLNIKTTIFLFFYHFYLIFNILAETLWIEVFSSCMSWEIVDSIHSASLETAVVIAVNKVAVHDWSLLHNTAKPVNRSDSSSVADG